MGNENSILEEKVKQSHQECKKALNEHIHFCRNSSLYIELNKPLSLVIKPFYKVTEYVSEYNLKYFWKKRVLWKA